MSDYRVATAEWTGAATSLQTASIVADYFGQDCWIEVHLSEYDFGSDEGWQKIGATPDKHKDAGK